MKKLKTYTRAFAVFFLSIAAGNLSSCGIVGNNSEPPIDINFNAPYLEELKTNNMYLKTEVLLRFAGEDGSEKECENVRLDSNIQLTGNCGEIDFGTYRYTLTYKYDGLVIAKSEGIITIGSGNFNVAFSEFDITMDKDNDSYTNLKEFLHGTDPDDDESCPVEELSLDLTVVSASEINLTWNNPACNTSEYLLLRNGTEFTRPSVEEFNETDLKPDKQYCYTVKATDLSGSVIANSSSACVLGGIVLNFSPVVTGIKGVESGSKTTLTAEFSVGSPASELSYDWKINDVVQAETTNPITIDTPAPGSKITLTVTNGNEETTNYTVIWGKRANTQL